VSITVFVCGGPKPPPCSVPTCSEPRAHGCSFPLGGARAGQTCDRPLCATHAQVAAVCPPHQRLIKQQAEKGVRE
jgi:hypothetical protein